MVSSILTFILLAWRGLRMSFQTALLPAVTLWALLSPDRVSGPFPYWEI
jgi:hypothetical protein